MTIPLYAEIKKELSESFSFSDSVLGVFLQELFENFSLGEDFFKNISRSSSESIGLVDNEGASIIRELTESFSFSDVIEGIEALFKTLSESFNIFDSRLLEITKNLVESVNLDDSGDVIFGIYDVVLEESFDLSEDFSKLNFVGIVVSSARLDIQNIIRDHGMQVELVRQTEETESMGDTDQVGEKGYTVFFMMQDITKKDRQIHEMGLAIPGNVKGFFYHEYPDSITGNGVLTVRAGDKIKDKNDKWWRIEQIIAGRKIHGQEIFRAAVLKKIDLNQ